MTVQPLTFKEAYRRLLSIKNSPREGLVRMEELLGGLGEPHRALPAIHVAGTNGKGSTTTFCTAVLSAHGLKTARFTSPHLSSVRERIEIDGAMISESSFCTFESQIAQVASRMSEPPTFFERIAAMAFMAAAEAEVDVLVLEVGLGGRLDATNIITPNVAVITPIAKDHQRFLGESLEEIAGEKAGIIKGRHPVVIGRQKPVVKAVLRECIQTRGASPLWADDDISIGSSREGQLHLELPGVLGASSFLLPLRGSHQVENAALAISAAGVFLRDRGIVLDRDASQDGLSSVRWPGRYETLRESPLMLIDGAHNPHAAQALREVLNRDGRMDEEKALLVVGATKGHRCDEFMQSLAWRGAEVIVTEPDNPRALPASELARAVRKAHARECQILPLNKVLELVSSDSKRQILVTGSLYLVGSVRHRLMGGPKDPVDVT